MKFVLLLFTCILISVSLKAQQKVNVVLKNGKTVYGTLVNSVFEDFITLEYSALERENIPIEKINSIHFGEYQPLKTEEAPKTFFRRERGFFHATDLQLLIGESSGGSYGYTNMSLQTVNGYAFNPHLMLGVGTGFDKYGDFLITPLYVSVRGLIMERKTSPFYYFNGGWGFMWQPEDTEWLNYQDSGGGYHFQGGLGYQINMQESALTFSAGYRLQKTHMAYTMDGWDWSGPTEITIAEERLLRRFALSFGFTF
ncbi:hypothetical protein [Catalinimonas niigatensis]|uniref:hypothetical protein n=1 Tax=Catalinimonas niigatensis TaxID=1397264 RepID=UPI0026663683|nr:hypothetical protein [Catalinimonas niigatensis]WPP50788.1 hypothetical protein PZB72_00070 [Catalinimonas niigatensis]